MSEQGVKVIEARLQQINVELGDITARAMMAQQWDEVATIAGWALSLYSKVSFARLVAHNPFADEVGFMLAANEVASTTRRSVAEVMQKIAVEYVEKRGPVMEALKSGNADALVRAMAETTKNFKQP